MNPGSDKDGGWRAGTVGIFLSDSLNFSGILETKAILTVIEKCQFAVLPYTSYLHF